MFKLFSFAIILIFGMQSCRTVKTLPPDYASYQERARPQVLAVFMDGTRDMPHSKLWRNTHVKNVHALAFPGIRSIYVEGVGAGNRLVQAAKAKTTGQRMMKAYRFLAEHYQPGDSICLFGFSRGANQCRILASFIYTIGILDLKKIKKSAGKQRLLQDLYELYVDDLDVAGRRLKLVKYINKWEADHPGEQLGYDTTGRTMIELLGLWDTVEAFEISDRFERTVPIPQHLNQLYNVKKLFHAVALDDNRAFTYTPILATHNEVALHPGQDINDIVEEVWFNGSHKDVGGGVRNQQKSQLPGITLRWMLNKVKPYHIFRDTAFEINTMGEANDMRSNAFLKKLSPGDSLRGIDKYWKSMNTNWNQHRIKVHRSVIDRLAAGKLPDFKTTNGRLDWYDWEPFSHCFTRNGTKRIFLKECDCIEVVTD